MAIVEHEDLIGEQRRLLRVVCDDHGAEATLSLQPAQVAPQPVSHWRVEAGEGLVEQQQPRLHGERAGDRDTSLLAA